MRMTLTYQNQKGASQLRVHFGGSCKTGAATDFVLLSSILYTSIQTHIIQVGTEEIITFYCVGYKL